MECTLIGDLRSDQSFNKIKSTIFDVAKRSDVTVTNHVLEPYSALIPEDHIETSKGCRPVTA